MSDLQKLHDAILAGDDKTAVALTKEALSQGVQPQEILNKYMVPALNEAGRMFEACELFVPELLLIARTMKSAMELIRPLLSASGAQPAGRVVIGTVKGDLHDIGKNLVASLFEGGGFEVTDLGTDVAPARFVATIQEKKPEIVALSALLTTTIPFMKTTIEEIRKAGLRENVKVLVGGAPVTQEFADEIGADGYSDNANGAVTLARKLVAH